MKRIIKGVLAAALVTTALTAGTISFAANTEVSAIEGVTATLTGSLDDSNFAYYGVGKTNKNIESTTANISSDGNMSSAGRFPAMLLLSIICIWI